MEHYGNYTHFCYILCINDLVWAVLHSSFTNSSIGTKIVDLQTLSASVCKSQEVSCTSAHSTIKNIWAMGSGDVSTAFLWVFPPTPAYLVNMLKTVGCSFKRIH